MRTDGFETEARRAVARRVALALIDYPNIATASHSIRRTRVGDWVELFRDPGTSPRADKLLAEGREYSPTTTAVDLEACLSRLARKLGGPRRTHQATRTTLRIMRSSDRRERERRAWSPPVSSTRENSTTGLSREEPDMVRAGKAKAGERRLAAIDKAFGS